MDSNMREIHRKAAGMSGFLRRIPGVLQSCQWDLKHYYETHPDLVEGMKMPSLEFDRECVLAITAFVFKRYLDLHPGEDMGFLFGELCEDFGILEEPEWLDDDPAWCVAVKWAQRAWHLCN